MDYFLPIMLISTFRLVIPFLASTITFLLYTLITQAPSMLFNKILSLTTYSLERVIVEHCQETT